MQAVAASSVRVGFQTLRSNPLRTVLSTLGVIMGVASLVAVLAIGDGAEAFARDQIARTTDLQTIVVMPTTGEMIDGIRVPRATYPIFTLADADTLARRLTQPASVSIVVTGSALLDSARLGSAPGSKPRAASVVGTVPAAEERLRLDLAGGRFFGDAEVRSGARVAVVTTALAKVAGEGIGVGDSIRLQEDAFEIIGIVAPPEKRETEQLTAYVPITAADQAMAPPAAPRAPMLVVRAADVRDVQALRAGVEGWAEGRFGGEWKSRLSVGASEGLRLDQAQQGILIFKMVMGAFAGISLIVGGIGIMNVLLAAVTERTREIGIRKATGARQRDILVQFLAESVAITGVGSVIGAALGLAGAFAVAAVIRRASEAQLYAGFSWGTLAVAALVSIVTGLAFGSYPALRASRLSPIEAIRHE